MGALGKKGLAPGDPKYESHHKYIGLDARYEIYHALPPRTVVEIINKKPYLLAP